MWSMESRCSLFIIYLYSLILYSLPAVDTFIDAMMTTVQHMPLHPQSHPHPVSIHIYIMYNSLIGQHKPNNNKPDNEASQQAGQE